VPVTTDGKEVIVGFDARRLEAMAARNKRRGLGLRVADRPEGGALVGGVRPDSPGARAGVESGDIIVELSGKPIVTSADLERVAADWSGDRPTSLTLERGGDRKTVILYG
jgi:putative serine protease PepD